MAHRSLTVWRHGKRPGCTTTRGQWANTPMATNTTRREEATGTDEPIPLRDVRAKAQIGLDAAGREHYHDSYRQCVWVVHDDAIVWRQDLDAARLADWVAHIESERGWVDLFYSPTSLYDRLREVFA